MSMKSARAGGALLPRAMQSPCSSLRAKARRPEFRRFPRKINARSASVLPFRELSFWPWRSWSTSRRCLRRRGSKRRPRLPICRSGPSLQHNPELLRRPRFSLNPTRSFRRALNNGVESRLEEFWMMRLKKATPRLCRVAHSGWRRACGGLVLAGFLTGPADAQDVPDVQRELRELRQHYDAELKRLRREYEARIERLEKQVKAAVKAAPTAETTSTAAAAPPPNPSPVPGGPGTSAALEQPPTPALPPPTPAPGYAPTAASAFNPAIGVVLNGHLEAFSQNPNDYFIPGFSLGDDTSPGTRGLSINETEVNFQANVDPYLYGNLTLAFEPNNTVSVEEGFIQSTSLPAGFTLRAGRFFSGIGYLNEQHSHTWDFADQALPYRAFLNTQYDDDGVQLRWLAPTTQFIELGNEFFLGNAFPAGGAANQGFGTHSLFAHTGGDIGDSGSYRVGLSWLHTNAENRLTATPNGPDDTFTGKGDLLIVDGVYKWAPDGNPTETNLKL